MVLDVFVLHSMTSHSFSWLDPNLNLSIVLQVPTFKACSIKLTIDLDCWKLLLPAVSRVLAMHMHFYLQAGLISLSNKFWPPTLTFFRWEKAASVSELLVYFSPGELNSKFTFSLSFSYGCFFCDGSLMYKTQWRCFQQGKWLTLHFQPHAVNHQFFPYLPHPPNPNQMILLWYCSLLWDQSQTH